MGLDFATVQVPSIILPTGWTLGTETETIDDTDEHVSIDIPSAYLQFKTVHITAVEVVVAGTPGPLWCWIEVSPYDTGTSEAYWAAIGGGGGALTPTSPTIEVATGVTGTVHSIFLPWTAHSAYARLVIQTPSSVATAAWAVQAIISGKG